VTVVQKNTVLVATLPKIDEAMAASLFDGKFTVRTIEELYLSYLVDVVAQVNRYPRTRIVIHYYVPALYEMLMNLFMTPAEFRLVVPKDTGPLYSSAIERMFKSGRCKNLLLLLTLHPLVNYHIIEHTLRVLNFEDESVAIGTLSNHMPYLLGIKNLHESLLMLDDKEFYDSDSLLRRCCTINGLISPLCPLPVIQTTSDLMILKEKLERLCETRHDYPKRTLSLLRQLGSTINNTRAI